MSFLHLLARSSKIIYSLILRVYYSGSPAPNSDREAVLAEVGKLIAIELNNEI